jgi:hypothetical protein
MKKTRNQVFTTEERVARSRQAFEVMGRTTASTA